MDMGPRKRTILVVDDTPENIDVLVGILKTEYKVKAALNGPKAVKIAQGKNPPDLILLDVMMPEMNGYEVAEILKKNSATSNIPIIFVTAMNEIEDEKKGLELGAVDYLTKPVSPPLVKARVRNHVELKMHRDHLEELVNIRTRELELTREVTIYSLASLAETRDNETGGHIIRTQKYVHILALTLRKNPKFGALLDDATIDLLYKSAPLHDIGKVGVPDSILLKPGKLTDGEFEVMKDHTKHGRDTILRAEEAMEDRQASDFLRLAREIAYSHHEKWDGSGYPLGLCTDKIPFAGRIMAVADVYDALISRRIYKPPFTHTNARDILQESSGRHFDPDVISAFLEQEEAFRRIALKFADHEEERAALRATSPIEQEILNASLRLDKPAGEG
ncbi:two-component system response regulator [uncultured Desulfosarcina sp.]|uniref:response regulator n=1 Tax=uncultured Desulfosarcina sp. TaxID=218289 RepID=UPI0029C63C00|nr:two-component system response regulator [uncultured Desulfosarcina sp.]